MPTAIEPGAVGQAEQSGGHQRGRPAGVGQREAGGDRVADRGVHGQRAAGQGVVAGEAGHAVAHLDLEVTQAVGAVARAGGRRGVRDEDDAVGPLGGGGQPDRAGVEVVAVDDELAGHPTIGQARADRAGLAVVERAHAVAEVGRHRGTGLDGGGDLLVVGVGVADGGDHALGGQRGHQVQRTPVVPVRR